MLGLDTFLLFVRGKCINIFFHVFTALSWIGVPEPT